MADQTLARYVNELNVLTLLRTKGPTSRASLSRQLELTPATMSRLVGEMARRGLLRQIDVAPQGSDARAPGRPGVEIGIDPGGAYGFFTIAIRRILENKNAFAKADKNRDGRLSFDELAEHVGGVLRIFHHQRFGDFEAEAALR